jgi:hypothetical protein
MIIKYGIIIIGLWSLILIYLNGWALGWKIKEMFFHTPLFSLLYTSILLLCVIISITCFLWKISRFILFWILLVLQGLLFVLLIYINPSTGDHNVALAVSTGLGSFVALLISVSLAIGYFINLKKKSKIAESKGIAVKKEQDTAKDTGNKK